MVVGAAHVVGHLLAYSLFFDMGTDYFSLLQADVPVTPEGKVKSAVKKLLISLDAWYYMPVSNGMGVAGIPDFIVCWHGWFIAIECKAPGKENTLTANQARQIKAINDAQGIALVVSDVRALIVQLKLSIATAIRC
jgi:hypothetical protein